ncbi:MAG TPA: alpha/beta hydrolase [Methylomirabilota bacterium]|nr:alpha/beta hydrolase [Methylomirabilota bacterium]
MTFFPSRAMSPPPAGVSERWIETPDDVRLHAWLAEGAATGPTLIWSHGNAGNIASRAGVLQVLAARGLRIVAYDYRGYGRSTGAPSEAGVYRDALAVYDDEVRRGTPAGAIVCFGESLGGAVSIALAVDRPCAAVIVVSTFTRLADVARRHYGPLGALAGKRFDSLTRVARLRVPLLVAHGDQDEIVPIEQGERLFAAAPGPKRFYRVAGARHDDAFADPALVDAVAAFARDAARR